MTFEQSKTEEGKLGKTCYKRNRILMKRIEDPVEGETRRLPYFVHIGSKSKDTWGHSHQETIK